MGAVLLHSAQNKHRFALRMKRQGIAAVLLLIALATPCLARDQVRFALVNLCDPDKIATLTSDRAANPRVRKITYWLEVARQQGREPRAEMDAVMEAVGWGGTLKGELTAKAMVRNLVIAERLGCLDQESMELLRRGQSPTVKRGPYTGEKLHVDHIIPRSVSPKLDLVLANLEHMPASVNLRKGRKVGQRQVDLANKLHAASSLSAEDREVVLASQIRDYSGDES
jgi:hypothetical protein